MTVPRPSGTGTFRRDFTAGLVAASSIAVFRLVFDINSPSGEGADEMPAPVLPEAQNLGGT